MLLFLAFYTNNHEEKNTQCQMLQVGKSTIL